mgnify:CR=1 FL=1
MKDQGLLKAIATYFDAIYFCDVEKLDCVFHPSSSLFDADENKIFVDPIASFRQDVATRSSPASAKQVRNEEIILIDFLSKRCALVKVRLQAHDNIFVDHLNFILNEENQWQIVSKVWHLERVINY